MKFFSALVIMTLIAPLTQTSFAGDRRGDNNDKPRDPNGSDARRDNRGSTSGDGSDAARNRRDEARREERRDQNRDHSDSRGDRHNDYYGDNGHYRPGYDYRNDRGYDSRRDYYAPGYPYPSYPTYPYDSGYSSGTTYGGSSCSPEVKKKNVNVLEGTVSGLLKTSQFSDAKLLADTLKVINSERNLEARIAAYCALVGVDAREPAQIAEFIGARDLAPYAARAQENLKLSAQQATILVNALSKNLLNSLNN